MDQFHYWFYMESPPDISIMLLCTFYQHVFYASHDTQEITYRSAVRPSTKANPNHRLTEDGGRPTHPNNQVLKSQLSLSDQDRMMLIHLTSTLCQTSTLTV